MTDEPITYMDCWHYIAPLIPLKSGDQLSMNIYVMVFNALKQAEERRKKGEDT